MKKPFLSKRLGSYILISVPSTLEYTTFWLIKQYTSFNLWHNEIFSAIFRRSVNSHDDKIISKKGILTIFNSAIIWITHHVHFRSVFSSHRDTPQFTWSVLYDFKKCNPHRTFLGWNPFISIWGISWFHNKTQICGVTPYIPP